MPLNYALCPMDSIARDDQILGTVPKGAILKARGKNRYMQRCCPPQAIYIRRQDHRLVRLAKLLPTHLPQNQILPPALCVLRELAIHASVDVRLP